MIALNEFGLAVWKHRLDKDLFAVRTYDWVDRVITIDESIGRKIIGDEPFTAFDFSAWTPMSLEEHTSIKEKYKEIYGTEGTQKC